ncbi:MAG: hypothetical protein HQL91_13140 [Magnetococcales bacterium]|nr:hypothetical protein [Magnetococcales bacterium]
MGVSRFFAAALFLCLPWGVVHGAENSYKEVYKNGRFTVRKVEGACKLEILLAKNERDHQAILALFPSEDYYGELFTEREKVGLARDKVLIGFDNGKPRSIPFVPEADAKDSYWRWQYLEDTQELLGQIQKRGEMKISFSNGTKTFDYAVPLKGSGKAVAALRSCR